MFAEHRNGRSVSSEGHVLSLAEMRTGVVGAQHRFEGGGATEIDALLRSGLDFSHGHHPCDWIETRIAERTCWYGEGGHQCPWRLLLAELERNHR